MPQDGNLFDNSGTVFSMNTTPFGQGGTSILPAPDPGSTGTTTAPTSLLPPDSTTQQYQYSPQSPQAVLAAQGAPAAAPTAGVPAAPTAGAVQQFGGGSSDAGGNILGMLGAAGGMGLSALQGGAEQSQLNQLQNAASSAGQMAQASAAPLISGVLPPGAQQAIQNFQRNATAQQTSAYARMGMAGSTGEFDAKQAINQQVAAMQFSMEMSMFQEAAKFSEIQGQELNALLQAQRAKDQAFSNALSNFTNALGKSGLFGNQNTASSGAGDTALTQDLSSGGGLSAEADAATSGDIFSGITDASLATIM